MSRLVKHLTSSHRCLSSLLLAIMLLAQGSLAQQDSFQWAPDFPSGSVLPPIQANDQHGNPQNLGNLMGDEGLLLLFSRSFDWCPYCISQLLELIELEADFKRLGINIATMTCDPMDTLAEAALDHGASFPLLQDEDTRHVRALGILNTEYEPGQRAYGIPYPGIFLLDAEGVIRFKFAEEDYRLRPDFAHVLEAAQSMR